MSGTAGTGKARAAGGVIVEETPDGVLRVLLVHRPRYDDWSFPKGKLKRGEAIEQAALREVREETGLVCRIISRLASAQYSYRSRKGDLRLKIVDYFLMEQTAGALGGSGDEVDRVEVCDIAGAMRRLSYAGDRAVLDSATRHLLVRAKSRTRKRPQESQERG